MANVCCGVGESTYVKEGVLGPVVGDLALARWVDRHDQVVDGIEVILVSVLLYFQDSFPPPREAQPQTKPVVNCQPQNEGERAR